MTDSREKTRPGPDAPKAAEVLGDAVEVLADEDRFLMGGAIAYRCSLRDELVLTAVDARCVVTEGDVKAIAENVIAALLAQFPDAPFVAISRESGAIYGLEPAPKDVADHAERLGFDLGYRLVAPTDHLPASSDSGSTP